jgi:hypothetical protein
LSRAKFKQPTNGGGCTDATSQASHIPALIRAALRNGTTYTALKLDTDGQSRQQIFTGNRLTDIAQLMRACQ